MPAKKTSAKTKKKTTAKKTKPKTCAWIKTAKGYRVELCETMDKFALSHVDTMRRTRGIYILNNWCHTKTWQQVDLGPAYINSTKESPMLMDFCPWCGSDLVKNWREPAIADWEARKAKVLKEQEAKAKKEAVKKKTKPPTKRRKAPKARAEA